MNAATRLKLGIALLVLGLVMPAGTFFVAGTQWPVAVKTVVSGILLFGLEIMIFPAVALMGKENFERIVNWVKGVLKMLKPAGHVSRTRYTIGLVLLLGPTLFAWITSYIPSWLPAETLVRVWINLGLDLIVAASLFVLGGDFWDKLRALFRYDAKVMFPPRAEAEVTKVLSA
jgi:hypothetical protein